MGIRAELAFLIISIMSSLGSKNQALWTIRKTSTSSKYYPKGFKRTPGWMKKLYKIQNEMIPSFSYYGLVLSIFYLCLGPANMLLYRVFADVPGIVHILVMIHMGFVFIDATVSIIGYMLYK